MTRASEDHGETEAIGVSLANSYGVPGEETAGMEFLRTTGAASRKLE